MTSTFYPRLLPKVTRDVGSVCDARSARSRGFVSATTRRVSSPTARPARPRTSPPIFPRTSAACASLSSRRPVSRSDVNSLVSNTESSVGSHRAAVDEWFGDPIDYAAAHAEWDVEIETVSGERTMIELTTDADAARAAADPDGTVLTAEVPAGRLISQYQDGSVFTPHIIEMEPLVPARS